MQDYRWQYTEQVAVDPYGPPQGSFGQLEIWCQESPQSALISLVLTFIVTLIIGIMGVSGGGSQKVPVARVSIEKIVLGDGLGELQAITLEAGIPGTGEVVTSDNNVAAETQDIVVTEVKDEFGDLPDPNASIKVDPAKAARLKANIEKLKNGIQIDGLPNATTIGGGIPISGIFRELIKDSPKSVFVIDKSGSMHGIPLQRVSGELIYALNHLSEEQEFFIIFFDHTAWPMYATAGSSAFGFSKKIQLVVGSNKNRQDAIQWINAMQGNGGTEPSGAMLMALAARPTKIILLSDGEFSPQVIDEVTKQNNGQTTIDCIGLSEDIITLQQIASKNKGRYFSAK